VLRRLSSETHRKKENGTISIVRSAFAALTPGPRLYLQVSVAFPLRLRWERLRSAGVSGTLGPICFAAKKLKKTFWSAGLVQTSKSGVSFIH